MFKDHTFPDWATLIGIASFLVAFLVFVVIIVRAIRMPRSEVRRMSELPLDDGAPGDSRNGNDNERDE